MALLKQRMELTPAEIVECRQAAEREFKEDCILENGYIYVIRDWCASTNKRCHVGYYGISDVTYGMLYVSDITGDSDVLIYTRTVY